MKINSKHPELGYNNNVEIIHGHLRALGFSDNSHMGLALAAHVWSDLCSGPGRSCAVHLGYEWGMEVIGRALNNLNGRLRDMAANFERLRAADEPSPLKRFMDGPGELGDELRYYNEMDAAGVGKMAAAELLVNAVAEGGAL